MNIKLLMDLASMASGDSGGNSNSSSDPPAALNILAKLFGVEGESNVDNTAGVDESYGENSPTIKNSNTSSKSAGGVLGLFSDISSMFSANNEHAKYADEILKQRLDMPAAIQQSKDKYQELAQQGLPGYEILRQRAINNTPRMLTQFEQFGSTNQILAELSKAGQRTAYMLDSINMENENQKLRNNMALLNFMSSVEAPMQNKINEFNISKKLAAAQERMVGAKEANQGVENVTSDLVSLASMFGGGMGG